MTLEEMMTVAQVALTTKGELKTGYYAVDDKRYRLDLPTEGRWKGWLFLSTGSDYHFRKKMLMRDPQGKYVVKTDRGLEVLEAIVQSPVECMRAYGLITGTCGVCGRKLEDPVSVELGIGPVCVGRLLGI